MIGRPFFEIGPKNILRRPQLERLAHVAGDASRANGVTVILTVPTAMIAPIADLATGVLVFAQGMDLEPLGEFEAVAANEPGTLVRATVFRCTVALPDPLEVRAELADHRWIPLDGPVPGARLAPLMIEHILPALRGA